MLCVFDCETVPDVEILREIYDYSGSDLEVCQQAFNAQKEQSGSEFLPLVFHKIICISALFCDEFGRFKKIGNFAQKLENKGEREILNEFLNFLNKSNPRLVSFNGRNFDLPLIMLRAMKFNLCAEAYFEVENRELNKNKWVNYRTRYDETFHIDLLDSISQFGAARGNRLDTIAKMLNLPGKFDTHGDDVFRIFYEEKNLAKIEEYCQSDVLNTYWLYLKYQILQGNLTLGDYYEILNIFSASLEPQKSYTEVFKTAIEREIKQLK